MITIDLPPKEYRYTDIAQYFSDIEPYQGVDTANQTYFRCPILSENKVILIHLQNGQFAEEESYMMLEDGVIIASIAQFKEKHEVIFNTHFNRIAQQNQTLVQLNTQYFTDGVVVYIPKNVELKRAIQIVSLTDNEESYLFSPRVLWIQEENSSCDLFVCSHTFGTKKIVNNAVVELHLSKNAMLNCVKVQSENNTAVRICNDFFDLYQSSKVNYFTFSLHGKVIRNNATFNLREPDAECNIYGLAFTANNQHVDNFLRVNHLVKGCKSKSLYKNIVSETSTIVFNGGILVAKDAQKTEAYQSSKAILLSPTSKNYSQPELEIYADDVKCSHGATVGQLNSDALFYMRSRGINLDEAKLLQMWGFACEVLEQLPSDDLRESISVQVDHRLRGMMNGCEECESKCCVK